jgi:hypothetical protein
VRAELNICMTHQLQHARICVERASIRPSTARRCSTAHALLRMFDTGMQREESQVVLTDLDAVWRGEVLQCTQSNFPEKLEQRLKLRVG